LGKPACEQKNKRNLDREEEAKKQSMRMAESGRDEYQMSLREVENVIISRGNETDTLAFC
jgi:hypothetical protein